MAKTSKKIRVRKSAPTIRERTEAVESKSAKRVIKLPNPLTKVHLPDNKPARLLKRFMSLFVPRYFVNAWREVRLVIWPSRKETWRLTLAVFTFAIIFGTAVAIVDKGLDEFFKRVILK